MLERSFAAVFVIALGLVVAACIMEVDREEYIAGDTAALMAGPRNSPVTLDYPAGGGNFCVIRGTRRKKVDVDTSTGAIDTSDPDLVRHMNCADDEEIKCDPENFNPNSPGQAQTATCKCVKKPTPDGGAVDAGPVDAVPVVDPDPIDDRDPVVTDPIVTDPIITDPIGTEPGDRLN